MSVPLISIIVPVFNTEPYLRRCVDSVLVQTHGNLEVILVDDGSTDGSGEICDEYVIADARVRVLHQSNKGVSAARNAGLDIATGEWVGFVDSDDWVLPSMYKELLDAAVASGKQMSSCGYTKVEINGTESLVTCDDLPRTLTQTEALTNILKCGFFEGFMCNKLYWAVLFRVVPLARFDTELTYCEDLLFNVEILNKLDGMAFVSKALYCYCMRKDSATYTLKKKRVMDDLLARKKVAEIVAPISHALQKLAYISYTNAAVHLLYQAAVFRQSDLIPKLKKESRRYLLELLFSNETAFRVKMRSLAIALCPRISYAAWSALKRRFGCSWWPSY